MSTLRKAGIASLCLAFLAGCTAGRELETARDVDLPASEYHRALYQGYLDLSAAELAETDYLDSDVFARRAEAAAAGETFDHEWVFQRRIPADMVDEMRRQRFRLWQALHNTARTKVPQDAAQAQVMFDCWIQEQEENDQPDDIAACRDAFLDAMARIEAAMAPPPPPAPMPQPAMVAPEPFLVYFAFDSSTLTPEALSVIDEAIAAAREFGDAEFSVTGHADRAGSEAYNIALSLRRANAVQDALVARGVDPGAISIAGRGESEPAVPTPDGQREQANRRVEIIIQ